jgi:hypothetical protein
VIQKFIEGQIAMELIKGGIMEGVLVTVHSEGDGFTISVSETPRKDDD